jgi:hypothetical protein
VLQYIAGRFDRVFADGQFYNPAIPQAYNTLRVLSGGVGYYVRLTGDTAAALLVEGAPLPVDTPLALVRGWNMVGYLPERSMPVAAALQSIAGKYSAVVSIDRTFDPVHPDFSTLVDMEPGQGYLIYMVEPGTLKYPAPPQASAAWRAFQRGSSCQVYRTPQFTLVYGNVTIGGTPAPVGTRVEALNGAGQVIGCGEVSWVGQLNFMHVYGMHDQGDTGARPGESVNWRIDGIPAQPSQPVTWQNDRAAHKLELDATMTLYYLPFVGKQ